MVFNETVLIFNKYFLILCFLMQYKSNNAMFLEVLRSLTVFWVSFQCLTLLLSYPRSQKLENVSVALQFLERDENIRIVNIGE